MPADLLARLRSPLEAERRDAARAADALGDLGDRRAVPTLVAALDHPSDDVKYYAMVALGKLGDARAVPALVRRLGGDLWLESAAVEALGAIGDREATGPLLARLDPGGFLAPAVAEALGRIGDPAALPALLAVVERTRGIPSAGAAEARRAALAAAARILPRGVPAGPAAGPRETEAVTAALADEDPDTRGAAALVAARLGLAEAVPALADLVERDGTHEGAPGPAGGERGRVAALELAALARRQPEGAAARAIHALLAAGSPPVRRLAAMAAGEAGLSPRGARASGGAAMTLEEFAALRDFIRERTGIHVRDNRVDYLDARVAERIRARRIASSRDYYYFLRYGAEGESELQSLVDLLTVQETSFFRAPEQLDVLAEALPSLLASRNGRSRPFRAWSAACATGEESVTLAIFLSERVPGPCEILATDISARAIATARRGHFPARRARGLGEARLTRYFVRDGPGFTLRPEYAAMVQYRRLSLADPAALASVPEQDVILCRNVFIYLSDAAKLAAAQAFHRVLAPWGLLLMGAAETIDVSRVPFRIRSVRGGLAYEKA